MNVLLSTTTSWNPGDDFIRMGCEHILHHVIGEKDPNYFLYDRNPVYMESPPQDRRILKQSGSNAWHSPRWDLIDLIVLAGTPEWDYAPHAQAYAAALEFDIPLLGIGIGSTRPVPKLEPVVEEVFNRKNTQIITRSSELAWDLKSYGAVSMPCPALFCHEGYAPLKKHTAQQAAIVQAPKKKHWSGIGFKVDQEILNNSDLITFHRIDYEHYKDLGYNPYFSYDPRKLLNRIASYEVVYSTRLHGAVAALSLGCKVHPVFKKTNYRANTAWRAFSNGCTMSTLKRNALRDYVMTIGDWWND